jgi:uncharacterized repeat protein (TIGR01451 family)
MKLTLFRKTPQFILTGVFVVLLALLGMQVSIAQDDPLPSINFGTSNLENAPINQPTSLEFGPDNRLYVLQKNGTIKAFTVVRNDANDYTVTDTETITLVRDIPNHNDDGTPQAGVTGRQATGMTVIDDGAGNPILYVSSSDPRRGIGNNTAGQVIDTNSGTISRLTWNGSNWVKVDLVRGLPRSAEYHATNGLQYDAARNVLYVTSGGHTNMGAPGRSLSYVPEYALAAAILEVDLNIIDVLPLQGTSTAHPYIYDIPTLDDDSRPNVATGVDQNDPFGGNRGKNQARIVPGGPVQVFAPGYRNPYDVTFTEDGQLYSIDNGPNGGFGGFMPKEADIIDPATGDPYGLGVCDNTASEDGSYSGWDNMHYVIAGEYAGHPNPVRGNLANTYNEAGPDNDLGAQSPVAVANPVECDFRWSGNGGNPPEDGAIAHWGTSTNGMTEYTASNFAGQMQGDILAASYGQKIERVRLSADGTTAEEVLVFAPLGNTPLNVTAQGDDEAFPGTVWAVSFRNGGGVTVFEPADYSGVDTGVCDQTYSTAIDADSDGYSNADEIDNGTNECNGADFPSDNDGDNLSDLNDPDDDNDSRPDLTDAFQVDATNGDNLPIFMDFDPGGNFWGTGLLSSGFTGLMTNGTVNYKDMYVPEEMTVGGIAKVFTIDDVPAGDATNNDQTYAFQRGVNVDSSTGPFTVYTRMIQPFFNGTAPTGDQSMGIYFGDGSQSNYVKLVMAGGGFRLIIENNNAVVLDQPYSIANPWQSNYVDLLLSIDPVNATVTPRYALDDDVYVTLGTPVNIPAGPTLTRIQNNADAVATGVIATSLNSTTFTALWKQFNVSADAPGEIGADPANLVFDAIQGGDTARQTITLTNMGIVSTDPTVNITSLTLDGSDAYSIVNPPAGTVSLAPQDTFEAEIEFAPLTGGPKNTQLIVTHDGVNSPTTVNIFGEAEALGTPLYRVNTGGTLVTATDGGPDWAEDTNTNASPYRVEGGPNVYNGNFSGTNTTDAPNAIFAQERWDNAPLPNMTWAFPVDAGDYELRLYFAEAYNGAKSIGSRQFNVDVEGTRVLTNFDQFAEAAAESGNGANSLMRAFPVSITGTGEAIDIMLSHGSADNPAIKGIEIVPLNVSFNGVVEADPASHDFGAWNQGATSDAQTFIINNLGEAGDDVITVTDVNIVGDTPDFATNFSGPESINPGSFVTFDVTFTPTAGGEKTATLEVIHDGENSPVLIDLIGTNIAPTSSLVANPTNVDFGLEQVNTTSAPQTITLSNTGALSDPEVEITAVTITGADAGDFAYTFTVPATVIQQSDVTIDVTYTPTTEGDKAANLVVTHDGDNSPTTIALTGQVDASNSPYITEVNPLDGETNVSRSAGVAAAVFLPTSGEGVSVDSMNPSNAMLYQTNNNVAVPVDYGTSGGADVIILQPTTLLAPNTNYTFEITSGVTDTAGNPFLPFRSTFTTGTDTGDAPIPGVEFEQVFSGAAPGGYTSIEIGPGGRLWAASAYGTVHRWDINANGTLANEVVMSDFATSPATTRTLIGLDFDPRSTAAEPILWLTTGFPAFDDAPHFSSTLSKYSGTDVGGTGESWLREDMVVGLPRSVRDHMTNSVVFGPDGAMYITQGSISAMGDRDTAWGEEPEVLLSSAVLRVDVGLLESYYTANGPLDVTTGTPLFSGDLRDEDNYGLGDPELDSTYYNPQAANAPLTLYATGVRNAFDLVWHSNGELYVPTNGSAANGVVPGTPATLPNACDSRIDDELYGPYTGPSVAQAVVPTTQDDLLFRIDEGGYYGHPNPTRCEWVMTGGNPTINPDPGQNGDHYPVGTAPDRNYRGITFNFENNKSPNGSIEYRSDTFGGALKGQILVTRYSIGNDIIVLQPSANGQSIVNASANIPGMEGFYKPLDVIEDMNNGNLYVVEFGRENDPSNITLLRPVNPNQAAIEVTPEALYFNDDADGQPSPAQDITISNIGQAQLNLSSLTMAGPFQIVGPQPTSVPVGGSVTVSVAFNPTVEGVQSGSLTIVSNDQTDPVIVVTLRGVGVAGEPSLQWIVDTYNIPVNVGDDNPATNPIHSADYNEPLLGQELPITTFEKAGAGDVTVEVLSVFGPDATPVSTVGWYTAGDANAKNALFSVDQGSAQTLNPALTALDGGTGLSFDPGTTEFGFYSVWTFFGDREIFSEEDLTTYAGKLPYQVRVYPLRDGAGLVPNAYVIATEETNSGFDFQDVVFIVRNVNPGSSGAGLLEISPAAPMRFSDPVGGGASPAQTLTINNVSGVDVNISNMTVNGPFQITSTEPTQILAGQSVTVDIAFAPTVAGPVTGELNIVNDSATPAISYTLRGLGTSGEPSLQWVLDVYGINLDAGDDDPSTPVINSDAGAAAGLFLGDEVRIQQFEKSGSENVTIEPLAVYANNGNPVSTAGWYRPSNPGNRQALFTVDQNSDQTISVATTGVNSFNPGSGAFGLYTQWTYNNRVVFGEDSRNTFSAALPHHARVYPLKDGGGTIIPNAYVVAFEADTDVPEYNDMVYIVRNVRPSSNNASGIVFENLDWQTLNSLNIPQMAWVNTWLSMSRVDNDNNADLIMHEVTTLRVHNYGANTLTLNNVSIADTARFILPDANDIAPIDIVPGAFHDIEVQFIEESGDKGLRQSTLTIQSNDPAQPNAAIMLVGAYTYDRGGAFEVTAPQIQNVFGYTAPMEFPFGSEYEAKGDEVLSPLWERMDPNEPIYVRQLVAYHGPNPNTFRIRDADSGNGTLRHHEDAPQTILPPIDGDPNSPTERFFSPTGTFKTQAASYQSDHGIRWVNQGDSDRHAVRFWPIRDREGVLVPGAFFMIQDFVGNGCGAGSANCDYNDNIYLITNIQPADDPTYDITHFTDIAVEIVENEDPVLLGDDIVYNVSAVNNSLYKAENVTLNFQLPANANFVSALPEVGNCTLNGGAVDCTFGNILGEQRVSAQIVVTPQSGGPRSVTATVATTTNEDILADNTLVEETMVLDPLNLPASLTVVKDADPNSDTQFDFSGDMGVFSLIDDGTLAPQWQVAINFTTLDSAAPVGYDISDDGAAYGTDGRYGWLKLSDDVPTRVDANARNRGGTPEDRNTLIHMQFQDCCLGSPNPGVYETVYWRYDLPNGMYRVTAGVGDPQNENSTHVIRAEGVEVVNAANTRFAEGSAMVEVTDGSLTIDPIGGNNTKILYLMIEGDFIEQNRITFPFVDAGTYTLIEDAAIGWSLDSVVCAGAATPAINITDGVAVTLDQNEDVTCTFLNQPIDEPAIDIRKSPDVQEVPLNSDVEFTITVTNIGTEDLTSVTVSDPLTPDCDATIGTLVVGATETYTCTAPAVTEGFTNTANVTGTPPVGAAVTDSDTAEVTMVVPGVSIQKTPNSQSVTSGSDVDFDIRVENTGDAAFESVLVTDAATPACDADLGTMQPGAVEVYTCTATNVTETFTNVAVVDAQLLGGTTLTAQDSAVVVLDGVSYGTPLYRVNAGGPLVAATDGGPDWSANTGDNVAANAYPWLNEGSNDSGPNNAVTNRDGTVPAYVPQAIFIHERWDPDDAPNMQWDFAVDAGQTYELRLYFANGCACTDQVGERIFDYEVEGTRIEDYDIVADVGHNTGTMKTFLIENSDGNIDIDFFHGVQNTLINGIEIVPVTPVAAAALSATPSSVEFGQFEIGDPAATVPVTLKNEAAVGGGALVISNINITGVDAADFDADQTGTLSIELQPQQTTTLNVSFDPATVGSKSASLELVHNGGNGPTLTVFLTGQAIPPQLPDLLFDPDGLTFSVVEGGNVDSSLVQIFTSGDTANYTIDLSSAPAWINIPAGQLTGTASDVSLTNIEVGVDSTGLAPNVYNYNVVATAAGYDDGLLPVTMVVLPLQYTVDASTDGNGTISPSGIFQVGAGDDVEFTITPDVGFALDELLVNGAPVTVTDDTYTLAGVSEDTTVVANFLALTPYQITGTAGPNGTIDPSGTFTAYEGDNVEFTITPNPGFIIAGVTVNGAGQPLPAGNIFTLENVSEDATVMVTFGQSDQAQITAGVVGGVGGTINPAGTFLVDLGTDVEFTVTPDIGFIIDELTVNGTPVTLAGNTYLLENISEDSEVLISFQTVPTYDITITAGAGGSIAPAGTGGVLTVNENETPQFTITADAGYLIGDVLVNGVSEGAITTYNFAPVTADQTIEATFISASGSITVVKNAVPDDPAQGFDFSITGGGVNESATLIDDGTVAGTFSASVNFQPNDGQDIPTGYTIDFGAAYADRGNGYTYGWVDTTAGAPVDLTALPRRRASSQTDPRLETYMHMEHPTQADGFWEIEVPNGLYEVTVAVGDPFGGGEVHRINIEGNNVINDYVPFGSSGSNTKHAIATGIIQVSDGLMTFDWLGSVAAENTKINYVTIDSIQLETSNIAIVSGLLSGTYTVTETVPAGWAMNDIVCTGAETITTDTASASATVTITGGEQVRCEFVNTTVTTGNTPPEFTSTPVETATEGTLYTYSVTATDADTGDTLTISEAAALPAWLALTTTGNGTATLEGTPGAADVGDHFIQLQVSDTQDVDTQSFIITVNPLPPTDCSPYSPELCNTVQIDVTTDVCLTFDAAGAGLAGTGFTMVDPASARLTTPSNPAVPGYEPSLLALNAGELVLKTTPGIQYLNNAQTSNTNSLVNGLGVGFDASTPFVLSTTLVQPAIPAPKQGQQAGVWFGLNEDQYVKVIVEQDGNVQIAVETFTGGVLAFEAINSSNTTGLIPNLGTQTVTLLMELNPATFSATGYYSLDGGATVTEFGTVAVPQSYFDGFVLPDFTTGPVSFGGVFGTHRNAGASIDFRFDDFCIQPGPLDSNTAPVQTVNATLNVNEGDAELITQTNLRYIDGEQTAAEVTYTVATVPVNGTLLLGATPLVASDTFTQAQINNGQLSYQHDGSETAFDSFDFTVTDGFVTVPLTDTFNININAVNDDPTLVTNDPLIVAEAATGTIDNNLLAAQDDDNVAADLIYTVTTLPQHGTLFVDGTPLAANDSFTQADVDNSLVTYQHDGTEVVADSFDFDLSDNVITTALSATFIINIELDNDTPSQDSNLPLTVDEGGTGTIDNNLLLYLDTDNTAVELTFTVTTETAEGTLFLDGTALVANDTFTQADINNSLLTYTHNDGEAIIDSFEYELTDGNLITPLTDTFDININNINDAPVIVTNSTLNALRGATTDITTGELFVDDVDNSPSEIFFTAITLPANGTLVLNGTALVANDSFTQVDINNGDLAYQHAGGADVIDDFDFEVTDNLIATPLTGTFNINVLENTGVPQIVTNEILTVAEGATGIIGTALLETTDTEQTAAELTYTVTASPANGTLLLAGNAAQTFTQADINADLLAYEHNGSETNADSFEFEVSDGVLTTSTAGTFIINITSENDAPVITTNAILTVVEGGAGTIDNTLLLAEDVDNTAAELTFTVSTLPINGQVLVDGAALVANGTFTQAQVDGDLVTYQHDGTGTVADSFVFSVSDGDLATADATFNITILEENDAPVAEDDSATVDEGGTVTIDVSANDTDVDSTVDASTVTIVTAPVNGTATVDANGIVTYTHDGSETISDSFTYTVDDDFGATSNAATVTITVTPVNDLPEVTVNEGLTLEVGQTANITAAMLAATDIDDDAATLSFNVTTAPADGTLLVNGAAATSFTQAQLNVGNVAYQHTGTAQGTDSFMFAVFDGEDTTMSFTFEITIMNTTSPIPFDLSVTGNLNSYPLDLYYNWTHRINAGDTTVPGDWYNVVVLRDGVVTIDEWAEANTICTGVDCTLRYLDKTPPYVFESGTYQWYVIAWTETSPGQWQNVASEEATFDVNVPTIQPVSNVQVTPNQGRPTISWDNDPAATWFQIWLGNGQTEVFFDWVEKAPGMCDGTRCSLTPDVNPLPGTYDVWMRAWGPTGFSGGGIDGWQGPASVTISNATAPRISAGFGANGTSGAVNITWTGVNNATWYRIWVGHTIGGGDYATDHFQWHRSTDLGCENPGTCTLTLPLANGNYAWVIQAAGPAGYNEGSGQVWSEMQTFAVNGGGVTATTNPSVGDIDLPGQVGELDAALPEDQ